MGRFTTPVNQDSWANSVCAPWLAPLSNAFQLADDDDEGPNNHLTQHRWTTTQQVTCAFSALCAAALACAWPHTWVSHATKVGACGICVVVVTGGARDITHRCPESDEHHHDSTFYICAWGDEHLAGHAVAPHVAARRLTCTTARLQLGCMQALDIMPPHTPSQVLLGRWLPAVAAGLLLVAATTAVAALLRARRRLLPHGAPPAAFGATPAARLRRISRALTATWHAAGTGTPPLCGGGGCSHVPALLAEPSATLAVAAHPANSSGTAGEPHAVIA